MAGYTAQAKLTWTRHRDDEGTYYYLLNMKIGQFGEWQMEVSSPMDDGIGGVYYMLWSELDANWIGGYFKTVDDAKTYAEKRVIKYFGLKENTDV